jgi:hypothetical protein
MENNGSDHSNGEAAPKTAPRSPRTDTNKKLTKVETSQSKSGKRKKWSLWQHWKRASRKQQMKWGAEGIGVLLGIGVLVYYVASYFQSERHFQFEYKPFVVNSRPPQLLQPFVCDVKRNGFTFGNMRTFVKNIGNARAINVVPYDITLRVVPENRTGIAQIDNPPTVDCAKKLNAQAVKDLDYPMGPGLEVSPEIRQGVGTIPRMKDGDTAQLYATSCVYYSDDYGKSHGTCDTYRLQLPSDNPVDVLYGTPTFACDGTPRMGTFSGTIGGHCQQ